MSIPKYFLSITLDTIQFAKDFQYFITVQYQNQKKRTDLSANARNPIFTSNTFLFPLLNPSQQISGVVTFTACVVLEDGKGEDKGMSKILGEVDVDLYGLGLKVEEDWMAPQRQQLRFVRKKEGKEVAVGRFIGVFKVVNEMVEEAAEEGRSRQQGRRGNSFEPFVNFPDYDPTFNFTWRVLIQVRTASNIPSESRGARELTPQAFVQVGWADKQGQPNKNNSFKTHIVQSNNPEWNSCFLVNNPLEKGDKRRGFICVVLKDQNSIQDIMLFNIPVQSMTPFVFYNLNIQQKSNKCNLVVSITLEAQSEPGEALHDIMVTDVIINPLPKNLNRMSLLLNTEAELPIIQFYKFDKTKESITRLIEFDEETKRKMFSYSISQVAKLPLGKASESEPAFVFTVPERLLTKKLVLCLLIESEDDIQNSYRLPLTLAAVTEPLSSDLSGLLVKKSKKKLIVNFTVIKKSGNPLLLAKQCKMTLITHSLEQKDRDVLENSSIRRGDQRQNQNRSQFFAPNHSLSSPHKPSLQKSMGLFLSDPQPSYKSPTSTTNQIVNRLLKQLDQKNQSLKVTASQVIDLRKQMKLMQSQNSILRRQATEGEQEIRELVTKEIGELDVGELREKIVKLAGMYRNERGKVKELEGTIRIMEPQIQGNMGLQSMVGMLENKVKGMNGKQGEMRKELERVGLYKETIKKQEKVIGKLEKVITDSMKDIKKAREDRLQLEQYRKNGGSNSRTGTNSTSSQIQRLQKIIAQLQQQNQQNRQSTYSQPADQSELEFRLYKAQQRCAALEQEISNTSKNFAKEVARLKLIVAEKQALLDGFTLDMD